MRYYCREHKSGSRIRVIGEYQIGLEGKTVLVIQLGSSLNSGKGKNGEYIVSVPGVITSTGESNGVRFFDFDFFDNRADEEDKEKARITIKRMGLEGSINFWTKPDYLSEY